MQHIAALTKDPYDTLANIKGLMDYGLGFHKRKNTSIFLIPLISFIRMSVKIKNIGYLMDLLTSRILSFLPIK
jgi:hypothetical protein